MRAPLDEVLLRSEATRLTVLLKGPLSELRLRVTALSKATDQALIRAKRSGRESRDLLKVLGILSLGLPGLLSSSH